MNEDSTKTTGSAELEAVEVASWIVDAVYKFVTDESAEPAEMLFISISQRFGP